MKHLLAAILLFPWLALGNSIVRYDIASGESKTIDAPAKVDRLDVAPDASVFISCGADVYRLTP